MGNPILIDWESARKLNPAYEIVNASLDWSGITTDFDSKLFIKIIEDGTHQELLAKNGRYKTLWDTQVGGFLPDNKE
jgi:hypothetical protein